MKIGKMWPQKDLEELRIIFQDLEDNGYYCYLRQIGEIVIYSKRYGGDGSSGPINYEDIRDILMEAIDRLKDIYDVDNVYFDLGLSPGSDYKHVRYDYPPDNLDIVWRPKPNSGMSISNDAENAMTRMMYGNPEYKLYGITIHTSPKRKIFGKIKNFLGFNENLNNDII